MAKELTTDPVRALNQIEQVRADAARAIAEAEALCRRMRETLVVLGAERPRFQVRLLRVRNPWSRN